MKRLKKMYNVFGVKLLDLPFLLEMSLGDRSSTRTIHISKVKEMVEGIFSELAPGHQKLMDKEDWNQDIYASRMALEKQISSCISNCFSHTHNERAFLRDIPFLAEVVDRHASVLIPNAAEITEDYRKEVIRQNFEDSATWELRSKLAGSEFAQEEIGKRREAAVDRLEDRFADLPGYIQRPILRRYGRFKGEAAAVRIRNLIERKERTLQI